MYRSRPITITLVTLIAALATAATAALADPKDQIAGKMAAARAAHAQANALRDSLEPAIEAYNQASAELHTVQGQIRENQQQIAVVKGNIATSRADLAAKLTLAYMTGSPDVVGTLFSAGSLDDMLTQYDVIARSQGQMAELIATLRTSAKTLAQSEARLEAAQRKAAQLAAQRAAQRASIERGIAAADQLEVGFASEIASLKSEQKALDASRIAAASAERRAALRAAQTAEANDPGLGGSGGGVGAIPPPPADGSIGSRVIAAAYSYLGVPYVWGGASRGGVDCSGLTMLAYASVGIHLDHFTGSQWNAGSRFYDTSQLAPGDLVFFYPDHHHVGIYIGGGMFIGAPQTGDVVKISSLAGHGNFVGAVRPY